MTNADVPYIATNELIDNPRNPFTGKVLSMDAKKNGVDIYMNFRYWNSSHFSSDKVILDNPPLIKHVYKDIFDEANWSEVDYKNN